MTTWKIARACAIGGAVCVAVALAVAPMLWWLGLLAGFASGYFAYEFREVLVAIPYATRKAWRAANSGFRATVLGIIGFPAAIWRMTADNVARVRKFFAEEHPFFYLGAMVFAAWSAVCMWEFLQWIPAIAQPIVGSFTFWVGAVKEMFACYVVFALTTFFLFYVFIWIGAREENRFWADASLDQLEYGRYGSVMTRRMELESNGYREAPLMYGNMFRWLVKGIVVAVSAPGHVFVVLVWEALKFVFRCVRYLVLAIHSSERVLCGVDAALGGGIVAIRAIHQSALTLGQACVAVAFGGILGAAFGVINYRVVAPRLAQYPVKF